MNNRYEILEYHKILNKLIDNAKLNSTKEKYLDLDIIKEKSELDKELSVLQEFINLMEDWNLKTYLIYQDF